jgi:hypothetical protein
MRRTGARDIKTTGRELYAFLVVLALALATALAFAGAGRESAEGTPFIVSEGFRADTAAPVPTGQDVQQRPAANSVHVALQTYVERQYGAESYVGPCENSVSPRDLWKRCTKLFADQGDRLAFIEGATFSEFSRWIFVSRLADGRWQVQGEAPFDFFGDATKVPWP